MNREKLIEYILLRRPQMDERSIQRFSTNALIMLHFQIEINLLIGKEN